MMDGGARFHGFWAFPDVCTSGVQEVAICLNSWRLMRLYRKLRALACGTVSD
ncbi:hypothetical protein KCP75_01470 [Salmonella enterica subsp. enterica]|nr:hypothetical protein KCP75_01470 [Salmonella enterica subsp. enterica]